MIITVIITFLLLLYILKDCHHFCKWEKFEKKKVEHIPSFTANNWYSKDITYYEAWQRKKCTKCGKILKEVKI
jgi:hypothetical protein